MGRISIGHGVVLLPHKFNHPIRVAERVAALDILSDGRVEFGTGRSSTRAELEGFDVDPNETREMWSEALEHIVGAWTNEVYQADGKHWRMGAPRRVQPKPRQKPHPPLWGATSSPDGHREIGRHGIVPINSGGHDLRGLSSAPAFVLVGIRDESRSKKRDLAAMQIATKSIRLCLSQSGPKARRQAR